MLIVAILALGIQTLAPPGHMIALGENGLPFIVMCPETHPLLRQMAALDPDNAAAKRKGQASIDGGHFHASHSAQAESDGEQHDHDGRGTSISTDCAFASVAQLATGCLDASLAVPALVYAQKLELLPARCPPLIRRARLRPPLRAPPSLA
ncbi:MAG: hypothetical protein QNI87_05225 [Erythrobacter sp.]|uniref:hypothetical protein n=1 Tax=Erythrobacter sp. TaxID=1042 RepID=UPI0026366DB1|nr:hypothetical protein [Erythrobacter sp.]MDJ0977919.1 hypothetical protein [Erythrobacter sp.]